MTLHTWSTQPSPGCHLPPPQNELTTPFSEFPSCHAWSLCTYLCSSLYFWHDVCNELQDELSLREWASGNYKYQFNLSPGLEKQVDKCWGFHGFLWPHTRACWGWGSRAWTQHSASWWGSSNRWVLSYRWELFLRCTTLPPAVTSPQVREHWRAR